MVDCYPILRGMAPAPGGAAEVGGKAWNLMRMAQIGLPVPPAFVLPTTWRQRSLPESEPALRAALSQGIEQLERATGLSFGGARRPLLVSVRSGAAISMPGMMETILDVGLNAETVAGLIRLTGNPRLAWDSYRRLIQGYAEVVAKLPTAPFDALIDDALKEAGATTERELDSRELRALTARMLDCYKGLTKAVFPSDPREQLLAASASVFGSWDAPKASAYRRLNGFSDEAGTAVTVQTMVYGNAGGASGAGVAFTRNPATGARELYFDFRFDAQGEDVVAGRQRLGDNDRLRTALPDIWRRLNEVAGQLEHLAGDAQDFEFTVQSATLYLLQTRRAKRTDWAAVTIAVDMVQEGLLTAQKALALLDDVKLDKVVRTSFAAGAARPLTTAIVASMGVASGVLALDSDAVKRAAAAGTPAILVRRETVTSDFEGMALASGILTATGGRTSHAAVVARQLGKVCLVACPDLTIDLALRKCRIGATQLTEGEVLSLDGNTGDVYSGKLEPHIERPVNALRTIAEWKAPHRDSEEAPSRRGKE